MLTVRQYQMDLKHYYGYYSGAADGINGAGTTAAVRAFQRGHSIFADGIYGPKTDARLVSAGMSLQSKVGVKQDGVIGPNTVAAIKKIQQKYGLTADGIAGTKTFEKLNVHLQEARALHQAAHLQGHGKAPRTLRSRSSYADAEANTWQLSG